MAQGHSKKETSRGTTGVPSKQRQSAKNGSIKFLNSYARHGLKLIGQDSGLDQMTGYILGDLFKAHGIRALAKRAVSHQKLERMIKRILELAIRERELLTEKTLPGPLTEHLSKLQIALETLKDSRTSPFLKDHKKIEKMLRTTINSSKAFQIVQLRKAYPEADPLVRANRRYKTSHNAMLVASASICQKELEFRPVRFLTDLFNSEIFKNVLAFPAMDKLLAKSIKRTLTTAAAEGFPSLPAKENPAKACGQRHRRWTR